MDKNSTTMVERQDFEALKQNLDSFFLIVMGSFVIFLQPAFALYESGSVRPKNVVSVLFRNYLNIAISTLMYVLIGFALSFGEGNGFCGYRYFALVGLPDDMMAQCFFQYSFAAIASTIPWAPAHERCSTVAFVCYTAFTSGIVYPIAAHWVATDTGWLHKMGFDDYAFSGVVHAMGGASCLAVTYMTGPRLDCVMEDGKIKSTPSHSIPQVLLGAFIFLLGMVAFNAGSQGSISNPGDGLAIAKVTLNTLICATTCAVTGLLHQRYLAEPHLRRWTCASGINGSFIGMVAICAGCNQFDLWGSWMLGVASYPFYLVVQKAIKKLKVDDVVDGVAVQIAGGYFGLLGVPMLKENGLLTHPNGSTVWSFLINALGGIIIMLWAFLLMSSLCFVLRYFDLHRVSSDEEEIGLDAALHKEAAYDLCDVVVGFRESPIYIAGNTQIPASLRRSVRRKAKPRSSASNTAWMIDT